MGRLDGKVAFITGAGSGIAPLCRPDFYSRGGEGRHCRTQARAADAKPNAWSVTLGEMLFS